MVTVAGPACREPDVGQPTISTTTPRMPANTGAASWSATCPGTLGVSGYATRLEDANRAGRAVTKGCM